MRFTAAFMLLLSIVPARAGWHVNTFARPDTDRVEIIATLYDKEHRTQLRIRCIDGAPIPMLAFPYSARYSEVPATVRFDDLPAAEGYARVAGREIFPWDGTERAALSALRQSNRLRVELFQGQSILMLDFDLSGSNAIEQVQCRRP